MSVGECRRLADFKNQLERDNSMITERVREIELLVSDREHAINMKNQNAQQVSYYEKFFVFVHSTQILPKLFFDENFCYTMLSLSHSFQLSVCSDLFITWGLEFF